MENSPGRTPAAVRLRPWSPDDLWLLRRTNAPEMTEHLGGPESEQALLDRHARYQRIGGDDGRMYAVLLEETGEVAGSIGFWGITWQDEPVFETGWGVLPEFQGRGVAVAAARAVTAQAAAQGTRRRLHAFPKVRHTASNAVCRKAGFALMGECDFEYPKGNPIRCNDWRTELDAPRG
ncbi:GNAT family N-acetyltransferase [Actinacidiphila rubida]|uniref:Protein N-acetyltransferase, RimJ/RimL family n=1 Tax=Actinacidiphila rubida TaxID=310780 RepID=A0A1H8NU01_9ACTN|nr:GNAT family N-acetyltransferase [Actinacidiphila rubida]SEO33032.1 Protein N-acetyltransferase, RimJ/RimL family [Actinacidiphila rubida]